MILILQSAGGSTAPVQEVVLRSDQFDQLVHVLHGDMLMLAGLICVAIFCVGSVAYLLALGGR